MSLARDQKTLIAANRFGFGARPGERQAARDDPAGWLLSQISYDAKVPASIAQLPGSQALLADFHTRMKDRRSFKREASAEVVAGVKKGIREIAIPAYLDQVEARVHAAVYSDASFRERLIHFWANHFAVSADKPPTIGIAGTLEFEAIRPHINDYFVDMLIAVERHPAMITYLDNQRSVGPSSNIASRVRFFRKGFTVGINENLAREILELHTLGVYTGYSQEDVIALAHVLTGWSLGGGPGPFAQGEPGAFTFRDDIHEPGDKLILGTLYREDGEAEGLAVLHDLALHPNTARHVSLKLARHFIADEPPARTVDHMTNTYLDTGGHLPSVYTTMIEDPAAWSEPAGKFKTPNDYLLSAFRALEFVPRDQRILIGSFEQLGQRPWAPGSPAGWPEQADNWNGADALMKRIEWADAVAHRVDDASEPMDLAEELLAPGLDDHTRLAVARAESARQGLTLLLASPEFHWR